MKKILVVETDPELQALAQQWAGQQQENFLVTVNEDAGVVEKLLQKKFEKGAYDGILCGLFLQEEPLGMIVALKCKQIGLPCVNLASTEPKMIELIKRLPNTTPGSAIGRWIEVGDSYTETLDRGLKMLVDVVIPFHHNPAVKN